MPSNSYSSIIIIITAILLFSLADSECIHSKKFRNYQPLQLQIDSSGDSAKYKKSGPSLMTPLNLTFSYLTNLVPAEPVLDNYILRMMGILDVFVSKLLKVRSTLISFPRNANVLPEHRRPFQSDLHLYVTSVSESNESYLAWASACLINSEGRPIFGQVNFNTHYMKTTKSNYGFQKDLETTLHQIIHVLGFSPALYSYWSPQPSFGKQLGFITIQTPIIKKWMKDHFDCETGAPLEDQGSQGSAGAHWERSVFQNELMTASDLTSRLVLSNLTLALLQSTGWYEVDERYAEGFTYGKGDGCGFLLRLCKSNFPEFCYNPNELSCNYDHSAISGCHYDQFSNQCRYFGAYQNTICSDESLKGLPGTGSVFQHDSRCFKSTITVGSGNQPRIGYRCYQTKCVGSSILITIDNNELLCTKPGEQVVAKSRILECPTDFQSLCETNRYCPNYCNQYGYCINGQCVCQQGRYGSNCQSICDTSLYYTYGDACVQRCPAGTYIYEKERRCLTSCPSNTYIKEGVCYECPGNCKECVAEQQCVVCELGSKLVNGLCEPIYTQKGEATLIFGVFISAILILLIMV